jgi:hypothetical protein
VVSGEGALVALTTQGLGIENGIIRIVGFLAGFSLAASLAAVNLLEEYKHASAALDASVTELQQSTEKVCWTLMHPNYTHI